MLNLGEQAHTEKKARALSPDPDAAAAVWLAGQLADAADGVRTVTGNLTPSLARLLLARNPDNRRLSADSVEKYARDIVNGNWRFNGEPVVVAKDGLLNDGQHRCEAVVLAGEAISVVFVFGVDRDSRFTLDQGRMRKAGDYLNMHGHDDALVLASAAGHLWQYRTQNRLSSQMRYRATKSEVLALVENTPGLVDAVAAIPKKGSQTVGGRSLLALCYFVFSEKAGPAAAGEYIAALMSGASLSVRSPILYARNRLIDSTGRLLINERAELMFRSWNAHRRGEHPKVLPILDGELPKLER